MENNKMEIHIMESEKAEVAEVEVEELAVNISKYYDKLEEAKYSQDALESIALELADEHTIKQLNAIQKQYKYSVSISRVEREIHCLNILNSAIFMKTENESIRATKHPFGTPASRVGAMM